MMEGYEFLCFGDDYGRMPSTFQRIVKELSARNKVLWVNSLGERKVALSIKDFKRIWEKISSMGVKNDKVHKDVIVFSPAAIPLAYDWGWIRRLNNKLILLQLNRVLKKIEMKRPIVMTSARAVFDIIEAIEKKALVYFCQDQYKGLYREKEDFLTRLEERLIESSDIVLVTSMSLINLKKKEGRPIEFIGQGVDYDNFSRAQSGIDTAREIHSLKRPVIGFCGSLGHWVDLELIKKVASSRKDWSIVLIGRREVDIECLKGLENVHYLGNKDYNLLPSYLKGFDCAIIPFKINEFTLCVNPLKALEYLAAGKPVVSTYLPDLKQAEGLVYLAHNCDEFISYVEKAMNEDSKEKIGQRLKYSFNYTWANRAELVSGILERILK